MDVKAVRSQELALVGYDKDKNLLEITFRRGGVYLYRDVPQNVYESLLLAESLGIFFQKEIKEKYICEKIR